MKAGKLIFVAMLILTAAASAFAQSSNVSTQQLTLTPQAPISVTGITASPSVQGSTVYFYWIVAHVGSEVSAPQGPALIANGPATLSTTVFNSIQWKQTFGATSYDVLRTSTSAIPSGACNCAAIVGSAQLSATDQSNSLVTYTVSTSLDQIPAILTNISLIPLPITLSTAGVFTDAQQNHYFAVSLTGGSSTCPNTGSFNNTETMTLCLNTPTSGVTDALNAALSTWVTLNDPTEDSPNPEGPQVAGVGFRSVVTAAVNHTWAFGSNPQANDVSGNVGDILTGEEVDTNVNATGTVATGILSAALGTATPTSQFDAFATFSDGASFFNRGYVCDTGTLHVGYEVSGAASCFDLLPAVSGSGASASGSLVFQARTSSATIVPATLTEFLDSNSHPFLSYNGSAFTYQEWSAYLAIPNTFANFPACSSIYDGMTVTITDSTVNTVGTAITVGGGSNKVLAFCNGTNYTVTGGAVTATPSIQSTSRTTLASNISPTGSTATTVVSKQITMPSSGCPCRVIAEYTVYLATNNWTGATWVTDGTNIFASGQTTGVGTNTTSISASEVSQTTYANSATPTFTLTFEDNGSGGTINAAPIIGSGTNTFLTLTVLTSN